MPAMIQVRGARTNNLKNIDIDVPRGKLNVFTGVSGSGKSSLAFDTIFAEGQRRYVESLSSYARQFLGQLDKPDVDSIDGLSPAISIDQKTTGRNPRSTVGTVTEIYDYLRLLWARIGVPHCPKCGKEIRKLSPDQIADRIMRLPEGSRLQVMAPVIRHKKGEHVKVLDNARKSGYARTLVDGSVYDLTDEIKLDKNLYHDIDIIVDRLIIKDGLQRRVTDAVETCMGLSGGVVHVQFPETGEKISYSGNFACEDCGVYIDELTPRFFSFNSPYGACKKCSGLGIMLLVDPESIIPNPNLSIMEGAVTASGWGNAQGDSICRMYYEALAKKFNFSLRDPVSTIPKKALNAILYGTGEEKLSLRYERGNGFGVLEKTFEGIIPNLQRRYEETQSASMRNDIEDCMSEYECPDCGGKRLKKEVLAVTVGGLSVTDFCDLSIKDAIDFIRRIPFRESEAQIAEPILREIKARLLFLARVGLDYLTLSRSAGSLSGGESQRIRLATQIGSALVGVLYILDEPSIGLHQRDNEKLLDALRQLRNAGNTLIVVEHDEDTIRAADCIVDVGPGAGIHGGQVVACGTPAEIMKNPDSLTGAYLSGRKRIPIPETRRPGNGHWLTVRNAHENNLKNLDVRFPCGAFTCVTGVSGSGKSSLVNEILYKKLAAELNRVKIRPGRCDGIDGLAYVDKVIAIDQSPIGRTPRSNPATYTGVFNLIRDLFASTKEAKLRGYKAGRFSFNVRGGRCENCGGDGLIKVEMHFLPDVYVPCEVCGGKRYNRETLEVCYKGKSIADVLDLSVEEALELFTTQEPIRNKLQTLQDVGLGYIKLGQASTTLSGGEAQRIKLATELSKRSTGQTVYILDEPTTGLHPEDVSHLLDMLQRLTDAGNTVIVIEHNADVIKSADYILDLGPEGGDAGGYLVFAGTPEACAECPESYTGYYLKSWLRE